MNIGGREEIPKDLTPTEFTAFRDYINQHSGIFLEEQKLDSLRVSLVTRATRHGHMSLDEYFALLKSSDNEFNELMNLVTINETSFYRFPQQFDALRTSVVPELLAHKAPSDRRFRAWSAGCSTGEEPYSIAMNLIDSGLEAFGFTVEVMGTDVSTSALLRAKKAEYPAKSVSNLPQAIINRHFVPSGEGVRIAEGPRNAVNFQYHNLIKEPYPIALMGNWDIIFCRNVTIYFRLESTRRVVQNLFDSLNPGGYLFIGHSETLTTVSDKFEPIEVGGVFLYRKPQSRKLTTLSARMGAERATLQKERALARQPERVSRRPEVDVASLQKQAEEASIVGGHSQVLELTSKILEVEPRNAMAHLLAANAWADSGNLEAAYDECRKAIAIDPLMAPARYLLGIIHLRRDERTLAISEFKRTIYIDSGFALAHLNLGNLYRSTGAMKDACKEYELTLRALYENPEGDWVKFMGGFRLDLLTSTVERSLVECRRSI
ncbi:MAG: hypothetical protein M1617_01880 [Actinobacteria bacterium]|nr:hypothetical protein [Actinomycetota bacterium]